MASKVGVWKYFSFRGALLLAAVYLITTVLVDKVSGKEWKELLSNRYIITKIISAILFGFIMEYIFIKWGKKYPK